ncbi:unnamed protein product [Calypogeia fissa]
MAPPPRRGFGKILTAPLLVFALLSTIVFLGIAAWETNNAISILNSSNIITSLRSVINSFDGNGATPLLVILALIAGVAAVTSHFVGLHHVRVWTTPSASAAQAAAWIAFGLLTLPFALVWKEIHLGGHIGVKTQVMGAFVIIGTVVHFAYTLILYVPDR